MSSIKKPITIAPSEKKASQRFDISGGAPLGRTIPAARSHLRMSIRLGPSVRNARGVQQPVYCSCCHATRTRSHAQIAVSANARHQIFAPIGLETRRARPPTKAAELLITAQTATERANLRAFSLEPLPLLNWAAIISLNSRLRLRLKPPSKLAPRSRA